MTTFAYCALYLLLVNLIAFVLYGVDKRRARQGRWRISESTLLGIALLGGAIGAMVGMKVFHHKTKHKKFSLGLPVIFVLQMALVLYISLR